MGDDIMTINVIILEFGNYYYLNDVYSDAYAI